MYYDLNYQRCHQLTGADVILLCVVTLGGTSYITWITSMSDLISGSPALDLCLLATTSTFLVLVELLY